MRIALAFLISATLLAACEAPRAGSGGDAGEATASGPVRLMASAQAGPGAQAISPARAAAVFEALCVSAGPSLADKAGAASAQGFVLNTTFGTYYHPGQNLSVKPVPAGCSMVFLGKGSEAAFRSALEALGPGISLTAPPQTALPMFRALKQ